MDTHTTIAQLDRWFDTGAFATSEARALAVSLRKTVSEPDLDATQDVFPTELHDAVIELMFRGPTSEVREAAVELIRTITRDGF